ncbi:hypothetical protein JCM3766R1_006243 [Sporobolomyces carnicolor]
MHRVRSRRGSPSAQHRPRSASPSPPIDTAIEHADDMPDSHSSFSESGSSSDMDSDDGNSEEEVVPIALRGNLQKPGPLEDDETRVKWVLDLIQRFCTRRGEEVEAWALAVKRLLDRGPAIDWASTLKQAERVLDRLEKGEFLESFDRRSHKLDTLNPMFDPSMLIVRGTGKGKEMVEPSHRLLFGHFAKLDLVLPESVYADARDRSSQQLGVDDFKTSVKLVAKTYKKLWPEKNQLATEWAQHMEVAYRRRNHINDARLRWNLIVVSEKVRTCEKLPPVDTIFDSVLAAPQNVPTSVSQRRSPEIPCSAKGQLTPSAQDDCFVYPSTPHHSAHSLGRIGIRQAQRIGFLGRAASDGGFEF